MKFNIYSNQLTKLIFIIILLIILVSLFNYFYDGGNEFYHAQHMNEQISTALVDNKSVLVCSNYNDRAVQLKMLENLKHRPQILILGSSRTLPITQQLFNKLNFYNASVNGGTLQDDIALYYLFQKKGWQPNYVVIAIDPWLLDKNSGEVKWRSEIFSEFIKGKRLVSHESSFQFQDRVNGIFEKYSQLLSSNYFIASLKNFKLIRRISLTQLPINNIIVNPGETVKKYANCYLLLPQGSRLNSIAEESVDSATADYSGRTQISQTSRNMAIDTESATLFEDFIRYLKIHHVNIIFYFPPYEPAAYLAIAEDRNYRNVYKIEDYFLNIAKKYNIQVVGNYDPNKLGLQSNEFIDYIHLKKEALDKIFLDIKLNKAKGINYV